jgi:hypothetical protein
MTEQEDYQKKMAQCTAWLREWVSSLTGPITVTEYELRTWKIYNGDPPVFLCNLTMSTATFASSDVKVRRRRLWTDLWNILKSRNIDVTPMGIAYPEEQA